MITASTASLRPLGLEIVADGIDGVRAAVAAGADRIELVSALGTGGVTPSLGLMQAVADCGIPVRAMVRPRAGDFTYSPAEIDVMRRDIDSIRATGLAGVVFGANHASGPLDAAVLETLAGHAAGLDIAIHRSFDLAPDPLDAIDLCLSLGLATILTSGGPRQAADGIARLKSYVARARGRIEIRAGGGVTADNAPAIVAGSDVAWLHAACGMTVTTTDQPPADRVAALGGATVSRNDTDADAVRRLRDALDHLTARAEAPRLGINVT